MDDLIHTQAVDLDWYLQEKILGARSEDEYLSHRRVLKYARNFAVKGARLTFVRERPGVRTPDLMAEVAEGRFYVEVRRFSAQTGSLSYPLQKIVDAVSAKRDQLVAGELGFVAIDSFDIRLESEEGIGLSHAHIRDALCELARLCALRPDRWGRLSGAIVAAATSGGVWSGGGRMLLPEYFWVNTLADPAVPASLIGWMLRALPGGEWFDTPSGCVYGEHGVASARPAGN